MSDYLYNVTSIQTIADQLKGLVLQSRQRCPQPDAAAALRLVKQLESAAWIPRAFELLMPEIAPGRFSADDDGLHFTSREAADTCHAVRNLLTAYLALTNQLEPEDELLDTDEAAAYLGITRRGLKYHLYESARRLVPDKKAGQALIFRRSTLDQFRDDQAQP